MLLPLQGVFGFALIISQGVALGYVILPFQGVLYISTLCSPAGFQLSSTLTPTVWSTEVSDPSSFR